MRRRLVLLALPAALPLTAAGVAAADVTTSVVATVVGGGLTLTGTGVQASVNAQPGQWTSAIGVTALTVSDLRLTDQGWSVTATYADPAATDVKPLGASNVSVTSGSVTGALLGTNLGTVSDAALTTPVTIASTGTGTGAGVTDMTTSHKVRVPSDAGLGDVYGATVTYTVATIR